MNTTQKTRDITILFLAVCAVVFVSYASSEQGAERAQADNEREHAAVATLTHAPRTPITLPTREREEHDAATTAEHTDSPAGDATARTAPPTTAHNEQAADPTSPYPHITAQSVLVYDITRGETMFERNQYAPRPIASITKLVTAAVVLQETNLSEPVHISQFAIDTKGNAGGLRAGDTLSVDALLHAALLESSNDAAVALAEHVGARATTETGELAVSHFVQLMNDFARSVGMTRSYFSDPSGLEDRASFSTAGDVARLVEHLRTSGQYTHLWNIVATPQASFYSLSSQFTYTFVNNNPLVTENAHVVGGKTGYTLRAGESLTILAHSPDREREIVLIVLGSSDRFGEMRHLLNWITHTILASR